MAKERSEWLRSRLLQPLQGILNRVRSAARLPSEACSQQYGRHQSSSSSMPRLIMFYAWKMPSPGARRPVKVMRLWIQLQSRCS